MSHMIDRSELRQVYQVTFLTRLIEQPAITPASSYRELRHLRPVVSTVHEEVAACQGAVVIGLIFTDLLEPVRVREVNRVDAISFRSPTDRTELFELRTDDLDGIHHFLLDNYITTDEQEQVILRDLFGLLKHRREERDTVLVVLHVNEVRYVLHPTKVSGPGILTHDDHIGSWGELEPTTYRIMLNLYNPTGIEGFTGSVEGNHSPPAEIRTRIPRLRVWFVSRYDH